MSKDKVLTPEQTAKRVAAERKARKKLAESAKQLGKLKIEYFDVGRVKPNEYNPNRQSEHDFELLCRSIEEDGFTQPVIVTEDLTIVDGEHRWLAAKTVGMKEIPVVRVDMTAEQARVSTIRHNRARGQHNIQLEAQVIKDLRTLGAADWMQDSLMMNDEDIHKMLDEIPDADIPDFTKPANKENGIPTDVKASQQAVEKQREYEKKMREAKNEEEREALKRDRKFYRLNLIFEGDEGKLVEKALGDKPSDRLLEWCQRETG